MDIADVAQARQQEQIDRALSGRNTAGPGRSHCENLDCGEPIAVVRQQMGAVLCLDCQRDAEREAQRCARTAV